MWMIWIIELIIKKWYHAGVIKEHITQSYQSTGGTTNYFQYEDFI